ncbi:MAG: hypothetical protein WC915_04435 [archaeon]|jgi:hypothetical protein
MSKFLGKKKFLNARGQAALMDSIFFLTIVATICTSLFFFAINYGMQTESQINSFYSRDFATDALKVITYINVVRDGKAISELSPGEPFENDYLLALIKEDYSDKHEMSEGTTHAIVRTLDNVMKPFDASIDYVFYLLSESEENYLFLLFATHDCIDGGTDVDGDNVTACNDLDEDKQDFISRKYFYCKPRDNTILETEIFPYVGKVDSAFGKVTLSDSAESEKQGRPFIMGFSGWVVTSLDKLSTQNLTTSPDYNCLDISLTNH